MIFNEEAQRTSVCLEENELANKSIQELQKTLEKMDYLSKSKYFTHLNLKSSLISKVIEVVSKLNEKLNLNEYNNPDNLKILSKNSNVKNKIGLYLSKEDMEKISFYSQIINKRFNDKFESMIKLIKMFKFEKCGK